MNKLRIYAMANEMRLGDDPAEFFIPLGKWPFGMKEVTLPDGSRRKVFVTQELDADGAREIVQAITEAAASGAGLPIYWGHPDVAELGAKYPDKRAKAWLRKAQFAQGALRLSGIEWNESPANGFKWFSPYWHGDAQMTDADNALVKIRRIESIGLTNQPNIIDFRLANEAGYDGASAAITTTGTVDSPAAPQTEGEGRMNLAKIIEALGMAPEATEEQVLAEIVKLKTAAADAGTRLEAANAETAAAKKDEEEALTELANERRARIGLLLDAAIADRRISAIARPAWHKRLTDNIETGQLALANEKPLKTEAKTAGMDASAQRAGDGVMALANEKMASGMDFNAAWAAVKRERPELFA